MALTKVSSSLVSDSAVTSGKIADGGVATADIATNAVTSTKIAQNSILTKHIDDGQVTTDQLGADAVTAAKIADDAISEEHLDVTVITGLTEVTAATGDLLMVADISDSNNLKKIPVSSILAGTLTNAAQTNITSLGALTSLNVDTISMNGSSIAASGNLTLDVTGDITLNADGGDWLFYDGSTTLGSIQNDGNNNLVLMSNTSDKDIKFLGIDNGNTITALTLDMSNAGRANFNNDIGLSDNRGLRLGSGDDSVIYNDGSNLYIKNGTLNQDIIFQGNDDGSPATTALTLNMSSAGEAIFNSSVFVGSHLYLGDNKKAVFGAGEDLQIFHAGGENFIRGANSASATYIDTCQNLNIRHLDTDGGNAETMIKAIGDGAVELYHNGNLKIATTAAGAEITGGLITTGTTNTFTHGTAWGTNLKLTNTNNDSSPPIITFLKAPAGGHTQVADNDYVGFINFRADNSNNDEFSWVELSVLANDITDGSEDSTFRIGTYGAGTEYVNTLVAASGKVGIGTASPAKTLDVKGRIQLTRPVDSGHASEGNWDFNISHEDAARYGSLYITPSVSTAEISLMSNKFRFTKDGRLGIGVIDPDKALEVKSDTTNDGILIDVLSKPEIIFRDRGNSDTIIGTGRHALDGFHIDTYSGNALFIRGSDRQVGIGTTSPAHPLSVQAANAKITACSTADSQVIGFQARYLLNHATLYGSFEYHTGDAQLYIDNNFTGNNGVYSNIRFRNCPNGSNTLQDRMIIAGSTGNVGIGNIEASHKLHVEANGTGAISALRLANENTSVGDGAKLLFTSGTSTTGAGIAGYGTALNTADLVFYAGGDNERMRIHDDGRDFDFTSDTANDYTPRINLYSKSSGAYAGEINFYSKHSSNEWVAASIFATGGSGYGTGNPPSGGMRLYVRGAYGSTHGINAVSIAGDGVVSGDFNDTSDVALKKDIVSLNASDSLTAIKALNPVSFKWKLDNEARSGFIAQEVETHLPNDVVGENWRAEVGGTEGDPSSRDEGSKGKAVNSTGILAHAVKVIQEQQTAIEDLQSRIATLEG